MSRMGVKAQDVSPEASTLAAESALLSLPFDHYQRYHLTGRIVSVLTPTVRRSALRILDVGGSYSSLKHFLPSHEVVLADIQSPPKFTYRDGISFRYDSYVLAAGGRLPFADASFDIVTAHDTLEHVPGPLRAAFLRDLVRVSRSYVILNGPVYQPETEWAERRLARFIERTLSEPNHSLDEHIALGLPERSFIESILGEEEVAFVSFPNGNLFQWLAFMTAKHYLLALPENDLPHEVLDRTYNMLKSEFDFGGLCYRQAYVVAKRNDGLRALGTVWDTSLEARKSRSAPGVADLEAVLTALEEHARTVRLTLMDQQDRLSDLSSAVDTLRGQVIERDTTIAERDSALSQRDAALAHLDEVVAQKDEAMAGLLGEIGSIQGSTGYRMLGRYRGAVRRLFPSDSWRGKPYTLLTSLARRAAASRRRGDRAKGNSQTPENE
jgi:Methyltransferase domain